MRYVTTIYVFLTIAYLAPVHAADLSANKPNIIFILADDSGFADFGCYGHPYSRTPNIDKLAADGTRFTQFYATGVTCCPTRTGLMTSKWPASYPTYPANGGFAGQVTVTELLQKNGIGQKHCPPDRLWQIERPALLTGSFRREEILIIVLQIFDSSGFSCNCVHFHQHDASPW